jgi:Na+-transporting methylmalonyl-CoA/oxaloacetate decarboxylase gamma subunit
MDVLIDGFVITGLPAVLIILALLALLVLGVVTFIRMTARGAKRVVRHAEGRETPAGPRRR